MDSKRPIRARNPPATSNIRARRCAQVERPELVSCHGVQGEVSMPPPPLTCPFLAPLRPCALALGSSVLSVRAMIPQLRKKWHLADSANRIPNVWDRTLAGSDFLERVLGGHHNGIMRRNAALHGMSTVVEFDQSRDFESLLNG